MSSKYIERFSTSERVLHWIVTASFFTLLLSGLGLYSRLFNGYFNLFGGGQNAILVHKIGGIIFFLSSIYMYFNHQKDVSTFDQDDKEWVDKRGGYLSREASHFNIGKYNPGQKLFALYVAAATTILGVTGIFIWLPALFPRWIVQISLLTHGLMFVGSIMFVIVHVYLATIGNPGTIDAMLYGDVKRGWAKKHHPKWYKETTGENT
ncbi:MAG: formate dehydrogenase subunit gamma [Desulfuromonadaceae bacterium]|nr:formate dehydrogenase subunit gamma [Desulfuromonadaceae bacterium]MDD5105088.1 formate dehydrogenase subunit gamma [Desulfuromonadaceae bacterium]